MKRLVRYTPPSVPATQCAPCQKAGGCAGDCAGCDKLKVSVVLVCHTAYLPFLPAAIASIDGQEFKLKILSFDGVKPPSHEGWIVVSGEWKNPNLARNAGLSKVTTPWVVFWDADNVMPEGYATTIRSQKPSDQVGVLFPRIADIDVSGNVLSETPDLPWECGQERSIVDTASAWRRSAIESVGGWHSDEVFHDDYNLALRLRRSGWQGVPLPAQVYHLVHGSNRSQWHRETITTSLWITWDFTFVTLWSLSNWGAHLRLLEWYMNADLPPNSHVLWVDNTGGALAGLLYDYASRMTTKSVKIVSAGDPYLVDPSEPYLTHARHAKVAALYSEHLTGLATDIVAFVEDDTLPPDDGVRSLLDQLCPGSDLAVSSGIYRSRHSPIHPCFSLSKDRWDPPLFSDLGLDPFEVALTGGGFCLIANWALQKCLPFRCTVSTDSMGWDGHLGRDLGHLGYRLKVDPSVLCQHLCPEVLSFEALQ